MPVPVRPMMRSSRVPELTIYTRTDCCLCEEMKQTVRHVVGIGPVVREIDIDQSVALRTRFGQEVPVLFINGRKAFKYRVTERELRTRLKKVLKDSS